MAAGLTPSTKRAIPLEMRKDLAFQQIHCQGKGYWVVKDPVALAYFQLQPEQHQVLQLLDGKRNLEEIREGLLEGFPFARPTLADIQSTIIDLHSKRLVRGNRFGQGMALFASGQKKRFEKLWATLKNVLYIRLSGWDPERTLTWLYPLVRWMFQPWAVAVAAVIAATAWAIVAIQFDTFRQRLPEFKQFFGWPNLVYLWVTLAITKIFHELGHGIACRHYGGECHQIGLILLVFSPTLYCDVSDSWMLPNKWQRIVIGAAGMYIEVIVSSLALFAWWFTQPGLLNHLLLNVFFISSITTVIFNLNPLMKYDGYYMLSDLLEIPNLTRKAQRLSQEAFAWYCLGIRPTPDPFMPVDGRFWFVVYSLASAAYRWVVLFGITLFLYVVLKPYELQSIGIAMAVFSVAGFVFSVGQNLYSILRAPRQDPLSKPKIGTTLTVLFLTILGVLFIPLPWHLESSFYIEPHDVRHVYTVVPGELAEILVKPGQVVQKGDTLARLTDREKESRYQELLTELRNHENELNTQRALNDATGIALARERARTTAELVADYKEQLELLTIKAPEGGTIVAPPRTPEPKLTTPQYELGRWYGTALDPQNHGALLDSGTLVMSIAPDDRFQAILVVDQADRPDLEVGKEIEIKFDHLADRMYTGKILEIADRHLEFAPETMSNKRGGELPTVTDPKGRERLTSHAYQAIVILEGDSNLMKSGIRGRARFRVGHRSAAQWLWREIRATFHFRL